MGISFRSDMRYTNRASHAQTKQNDFPSGAAALFPRRLRPYRHISRSACDMIVLRHDLREFVYELTSSLPPARVEGGSRVAVHATTSAESGESADEFQIRRISCNLQCTRSRPTLSRDVFFYFLKNLSSNTLIFSIESDQGAPVLSSKSAEFDYFHNACGLTRRSRVMFFLIF